jgi:hypothetical protein
VLISGKFAFSDHGDDGDSHQLSRIAAQLTPVATGPFRLHI